jgi:alkylation response protein AidB-like acyl-CoA dehydrogenase
VVEALKGTQLRSAGCPASSPGETVGALAVDEGAKHRPESIAMRAERSGNGFRLSGAQAVRGAGRFGRLLRGRRKAEEGVTLFTVEQDARGLEVEGVRLADSSIGARLDFNGVEVDADAVIGEVGQGEAVLGRVLRAGRAGAASRWWGSARPRWT